MKNGTSYEIFTGKLLNVKPNSAEKKTYNNMLPKFDLLKLKSVSFDILSERDTQNKGLFT